MSDARLKTKIRNLVKNSLGESGFKLLKPRIVERDVDGMKQGVEFQPGTGHLRGRYTLNVYWRFNYLPKDHLAFDSSRRIGELTADRDTWFSRESDGLDADFDRVVGLFETVIIPYLDRYSSLEMLIDAYLNGAITKAQAFGHDPGWQCFNAGFSLAALNKTTRAVAELKELIERHSSDDRDWVLERKIRARDMLAQLRS